MIALTPVIAACAAAAGGVRVARTADPLAARSLAIRLAAGIAAGTVLLTGIALLGGGGAGAVVVPVHRELATVPVALAVMALVVTSMAPTASHPPRTLGRVLGLVATALVGVATDIPAVIASTWLVSAWIAWREVRSRRDGNPRARLFSAYHLASGTCLVGGIVLVACGRPTQGVPLIVIAVAIREAMLPLHSWFTAFVEGTPLGVVVAFATPQIGVFAHLALLGDIPAGLAHEMAAAAAVTAVGAAALGVVQDDARRALAYLMISQTGLVAFGLENESVVARAGAILNWQVLILAVSGFAMTLAALEARRGRLSLRAPSGCFARTPRLASALLCLGFASVGFPMSLGFVAEDLLVQGAVDQLPLFSISIIVATALNGITVMRAFFYLFSGTARHGGETDLRTRELRALTVVLAALLVGGAFPERVLSISHPAPEQIPLGAHQRPPMSSRLGSGSGQAALDSPMR